MQKESNDCLILILNRQMPLNYKDVNYHHITKIVNRNTKNQIGKTFIYVSAGVESVCKRITYISLKLIPENHNIKFSNCNTILKMMQLSNFEIEVLKAKYSPNEAERRQYVVVKRSDIGCER